MEYNIMRELNVNEIKDVNGGNAALNGFNWGAALGTVGGAISTGSSIGATRFGILGGAAGFVGGLSYGIATVLGAGRLGRAIGSGSWRRLLNY